MFLGEYGFHQHMAPTSSPLKLSDLYNQVWGPWSKSQECAGFASDTTGFLGGRGLNSFLPLNTKQKYWLPPHSF